MLFCYETFLYKTVHRKTSRFDVTYGKKQRVYSATVDR